MERHYNSRTKIVLSSIFLITYCMFVLLTTSGCGIIFEDTRANEPSCSVTAITQEQPKEDAKTDEQNVSAVTTVPVETLPYGLPEAGWTEFSSLKSDSSDGRSIILHLYSQEGTDGHETRAFLEYSNTMTELGTVSSKGTEHLFAYWHEMTNNEIEELIITGQTGASAVTTKVLSLDTDTIAWRLLLEANNLNFIDLDENPGMDAVSTSVGSLPSFVKIYSWNGNCFEELDAAIATGNDYATLADTCQINWIIAGKMQDGKTVDSHYYAYRNSALTEYPKEFAVMTSEENRCINNFEFINNNDGSFDLNGDGTSDKILLECEPGSYDFNLYVNNCSITGTGDNLDGVMYLCDIDSSDKYMEIAITESGPSADYKTAFYSYDGDNLFLMGIVQGDVGCINMTGSGTFSTKTRGDIIQTWCYTDVYRLSPEHKLENVPQDTYAMNILVNVVKEMKLQRSKTDTTTSLDLKPGEIINMAECDNLSWCLIRTADGREGWFQVDGFDEVMGTGLHVSDYFSGLCYAG